MRPTIHSLQNPRVKEAVHLRETRARKKSGLILVDGLREVSAALAAKLPFSSIFVPENSQLFNLEPSDARQASQAILTHEALQTVSQEVFEKLCFGQRDSLVVAVARAPETPLERLRLDDEPLVLVLDRPEKPGNVGAVLRTASAAGVDAVILCDSVCDVFNPNAIRASLGTIFSVPLATTTFEALSDWLKANGIRVLRSCVDGSHDLWQTDFRGARAIVFGSEAHGLGAHWNQEQWPAFSISMVGAADSLNLSNSAAIATYEAIRQRRISSNER